MNKTFANPDPKKGTMHADEIAESITLAVHQHRISPGTKLGEDELGEIFGVSRTIIRAALRTLNHQQLVEIHRNRGAFVAQPTVREAHEVFEARELIEPRTAHRAAARATKSDVKLLYRHIEDEHVALANSDNGAALHLSGLFHIEIARIANQHTIAAFIEELIARSSLIIALYWGRESALCERHAHHALVDAIANGDSTTAQDLMRSHLVDLHSALDLSEKKTKARSLKDALSR